MPDTLSVPLPGNLLRPSPAFRAEAGKALFAIIAFIFVYIMLFLLALALAAAHLFGRDAGCQLP